MQRIGWFGAAAAAAVLIVAAAVFGLRGTAPPKPATTPAPPAVATAPAPAPTTVVPSFDIVRVDPHGQVVIAGRAAPGDRVRILDGDTALGEVTADPRGEWVLVPDQPLAPGSRQLSLEASGQGGGAMRRSEDVVALSVAPPVSPGAAPSALAVLLPGDAKKPVRVLQHPATGERQGLSLDTAEYGAGGRLALSGHAAPGARVNVYAGDKPLGTATADAAGSWSLNTPYREPTGGAELRLDELAADGSVARRIALPLAAPGAAVAEGGGNYTVQRGN